MCLILHSMQSISQSCGFRSMNTCVVVPWWINVNVLYIGVKCTCHTRCLHHIKQHNCSNPAVEFFTKGTCWNYLSTNIQVIHTCKRKHVSLNGCSIKIEISPILCSPQCWHDHSVTAFLLLFYYIGALGHKTSIGWNSFPVWNSRRIMWILECHQSLHWHQGEE